jgi:RNA polymerase sigma factor for flagellar operon FliA
MTAQSVDVQSQKDSSLQARDQIVIRHLSLVRAIAILVHQKLPTYIELDDVIHAGVIGLLDAVEKYDSSKNVEFPAYAKHRIKGAILDSLREFDWASRDMRRRQKQVETISRNLSTELGRAPSETEVAKEMGVTTERWRRIAIELRTCGPLSTSPREDQDRVQEMDCAAAPEGRPDRICEQRLLRSTLARIARGLPQRYQKIVSLYYNSQMTMKRIGDLLGVNESRISQIHRAALKQMLAMLQSEGISSANVL